MPTTAQTRPAPVRLRVTRLEDRTTPALILPTTFAIGEEVRAELATRVYDTTNRDRTDPSLVMPYATLHDQNGDVETSVGLGPMFSGRVRVARADFTGDGVDDLAVGAGPGGPPLIRVYAYRPNPFRTDLGGTLELVHETTPFEAAFTGGVYVAAGDLTGDGRADLVITPDQGGGPRVRVLDGQTLGVVADFFGIEDPAFRGGARAAVGDVTGDERGDLLVAAGFGGGPRIAVWDGSSLTGGAFTAKPTPDFFVFEPTLRNGVFLTSGDLDGDGFDDVIAGSARGGGPRVFALSGRELVLDTGRQRVLANFFAGDPSNRGGVRLAVKNLNGDNRADLVTASGDGNVDFNTSRQVIIFSGATLTTSGTPPPLDELFNGGGGLSFVGGLYVG
ncbi:MAG TPA: VCBS repeat-containing protein [Fimbriiglobus sp.]|nr:VCBS repeat-containing protein [Fimbriiglobus sp.]